MLRRADCKARDWRAGIAHPLRAALRLEEQVVTDPGRAATERPIADSFRRIVRCLALLADEGSELARLREADAAGLGTQGAAPLRYDPRGASPRFTACSFTTGATAGPWTRSFSDWKKRPRCVSGQTGARRPAPTGRRSPRGSVPEYAMHCRGCGQCGRPGTIAGASRLRSRRGRDPQRADDSRDPPEHGGRRVADAPAVRGNYVGGLSSRRPRRESSSS